MKIITIIVYIIFQFSSIVEAADEPTTLNNNSSIPTEVVPDDSAQIIEQIVADWTSSFEKECKTEGAGPSGNKAGLFNFVYTKRDFKIMEVTSLVKKVKFNGPFSWSSPGSREIDTTDGTFSGAWTLFPADVTTSEMEKADFVIPEYNVYNSYVDKVVVGYYTMPGTACSSTIPCPTAWSNFYIKMTSGGVPTPISGIPAPTPEELYLPPNNIYPGLKNLILARNPDKPIPNLSYEIPDGNCTELHKTAATGSLTTTPPVVGLPGAAIRDITQY